MSDQAPILPNSSVNGALAVFLRAFWMLLGNMILGLSALSIAKGTAQFSIADMVYWGTAPLVLLARYLDITRCAGKTAAGEPATLAEWRFHAAVFIAAAIAVWFAAHGIAYFLQET